VQIPYDPNLPFYFNNHHKFIKARLAHLEGKKGLFEKKQIQWFTLEDMQHKRGQFRTYYKPMLDLIAENAGVLMANSI
jgi:hypothetical protein